MELIDYLGMHSPEQFDELWDKAVFLEHYVNVDGVKYHLYYLHDFYVELTSINDVLDPNLSPFVRGARLDKYQLDNLRFLSDVLGSDGH